MEEGCTIDGKFHNLEVENLLTAGKFGIDDDLSLNKISLQQDINIGTTATIGTNLSVGANSTIQGDLTVDTNTLVVNSTNNNVGIATNLPNSGFSLDVDGNVQIRGNLNVLGDNVGTEQQSTTITGPLQELGTGTTGEPINDIGIIMDRGSQPTAFMGWDESEDKFIMGTGTEITVNSLGNSVITPQDLQVSGIIATNLTGTIQTAAQPNITTVGTIGTGVWQGTAIADAYISSASTWNAKQNALSFGISNNDIIKCGSGISDNDFLKINGTTLEGRSASEVKTDLSLNNVENTAISTFAGSTNITTLGTIGTGVWQGTPISIANGGTGATTASGAASAIGLGPSNTPQFSEINLGDANDTTIARSSPGVVTIEGSEIRTGTVPTTKGGTGISDSYSNGNILIGNASGGLTKTTITQGPGISITNGDGSIQISADSSAFIALTDTPNTFSSEAKKILQVKDDSSGLEFTNTPEFTGINIVNNSLGQVVDSIIGFCVDGSNNQFTIGVDDGDADKFKIGTTAIGLNTRLTIDSSGNVGIGNSSPGHTLDVSGDINLTGNLKVDGSNAVFSNWSVVSGSGNIYRNSNVGIGTNNPDTKLHINEPTGGGNPQLKIGYDNTNYSTISVASNSDTTFATAQSGVFNFSDNVNAQAGLDVTGGDITITGNSTTVGLTINNTDTTNDAIIKLASGVSTRFIFGIDGGDNDKFKISTDSSNISSDARFTIDSSGNVGIGTTSSQSLLHLESSTTPQFIIGHDTNNYSTISVASNSDTTFATQQNGVFNFSDNVNANAGLVVSGAALTITNQAITQSTGGQVTFAGNVDATAGLDVTGAALTIDNQAITQSTGGQVTFAGNIDATAGLDVTGAALTITNQAITQSTGGQVTFAGNVDATSGLDVTGAALTIDNQAITQSTGGQVTFAGNVDATAGLDVTGAALTTNQTITQTGTGQVTFSGNVDATTGLDVTGAALTTNQAITQTGSGQVTFSGNVDATNGLDVTGGALTITDQAITQTGSGQVTFTGNVDATSGLDVTGAALTTNQAITQTGSSQVTFEGNVGIGTTSPTKKLEVYPDTDSSAIIGRAHVGNALVGSGLSDYAAFSHFDHASLNNYALYQGNTGETLLNSASGNLIRFRIANLDKMVINSSGNVGIGTDNPSQKLEVNGYIKSTPIGCFVEKDTTTTVGTNFNNVIFNTTITNGGWTSGHYNATTGEFTTPLDGFYYVSTQVRFDSNAASYIRVIISVDGSSYGNGGGHIINGNKHSTDYQSLSLSNIVKVAANKIIKIQAYSHDDNSWAIQVESYLSIFLVNTY